LIEIAFTRFTAANTQLMTSQITLQNI